MLCDNCLISYLKMKSVTLHIAALKVQQRWQSIYMLLCLLCCLCVVQIQLCTVAGKWGL